MFVGHFAVGLAAKRAAPRASLGTLMLASLVPDLLVWALVVAGIEHVAVKPGITRTNPFDLYDYPISHSLAMDVVWGILFAAAYYAIRRYWRGTLLMFAAVVSHWFLDFASHRPDMPLAPGLRQYYGLGLYNSLPGMLLIEGLLWLAGIVIYARMTRSRGRTGAYAFWTGVGVLTLVWLNTLKGAAPRQSIAQVGLTSLIFMALVVAWAYWVDGRRASIHAELAGERLIST